MKAKVLLLVGLFLFSAALAAAQEKEEGVNAGQGQAAKNVRPLRQTRWSVVMPKENPEAFRKKIIDLKAMLLLPDINSALNFHLCENLEQQPLQFRAIDKKGVNALNRLWFISHDQTGREQLTKALSLQLMPAWFALFIPPELEVELLKQETKHQGMSEEELITRGYVTVFEVERRGNTWDVRVTYQGPKQK
jgi:hypothetical protein